MNPEFGFLGMNDRVVFKVEITVFGELESVDSPCRPSTSCLSLGHCLHQLLTSEQDTDVHILCESECVKAHRAVLIARSPVFHAMLSRDGTTIMQEASSGIVEMKDVSAALLRHLIEYIYTDTAPTMAVLESVGDELACLASKYEVLGLVALCEDFLIGQLSLETAIPLLLLADTHSLPKLRSSSLQFIGVHGEEIVQSKDFCELEEEMKEEVCACIDAARRKRGCSMSSDCVERRMGKSCVIM
jgi:hypothetical protein